MNKQRIIAVTLMTVITGSAYAQEAAGRAVVRADWEAQLPVFAVVVLVTLAVDAIFMRLAVRNLRNGRS